MPTAIRPPSADRSGLLERKAAVGALALVAASLLVMLSAAKWEQAHRTAALSSVLRGVEGVEHRLHEAESQVLRMQSARLGFVLNGGEDHARRFDDAARKATRELTVIDEVVAGDAPLRALTTDVQAVKTLLREYEAQLRESIEVYRRRPDDLAAQMHFTVEGQALALHLQSTARDLELALENQYVASAQAQTRSLSAAQRLDIALFVAAGATLSAALALAWRQTVRRERALAALSAAHAGLEQEVQRRTADLGRVLKRYRSLTELSEDAILVCGPDRLVQYANPAAKALFGGLGHRDIVGTGIDRLLAPARREALLLLLDGLSAGAPRSGFVATALAGPGEAECPVELAAATADDDGTEARQTLVILHDMRLHASQQSALREQIEFVEHLVEAMPLPLSLHDGQGRVTRVNRAFEAFYGVDRSAIVGLLATEVLSPAQAESLVPQFAADAAQAGGVVEHETSWRGADGLERVVQVRQQALRRRDGASIGVISVQTDVTALRQHEQILRQHRDRLGELASQLIASQENERRHVARELHDQVGQILTALHMQLAARNASGGPAGTLDAPLELAEEALKHTRDLTASLHPHVLDDLGLKAALNWLIQRYVLPTLGEVEFDCELVPERGDPAIELVAFRVVQEALTNVVRHAKASCAEVGLHTGEGWLRLDVADDGEGFSAGDTWFDGGRQTSIGVASMRERVQDLGGEFDIDSAPGMGTRLRVLLPWPSLATQLRGVHAGLAG